MEDILKLIHLSKRFGSVEALTELDLSLGSGIYGLIGPNGAGKSTLINLISTLIKPSTGSITYKGEDIYRLGQSYRSLIGLMPQHQQGYERFHGDEFLFYMASLKGIKKTAARQQIDALVNQVDLTKAIHRPIRTYSGGMRQRLMFAQALIGDPKLVILDEPTAGLDPYERIRLRNYISEIAADRIILVATHVMSDVETIADELILIKQGKLIFKGSAPALTNALAGKVHEIWIDPDAFEWYQHHKKVSRVVRGADKIFIRFIDDDDDGQDKTVANLEDAYLYYMVENT